MDLTPVRYVGPRRHLQGKTALARTPINDPTPGWSGEVEVQFDDRKATLFDPYDPSVPSENWADPKDWLLGFGWHSFPNYDFELVAREEWTP